MRCILASGIELEYEVLGDGDAPGMLLVSGLGGQLVSWEDGLCQLLAGRGFQVVRFDNRDSGLSTKVAGAAPEIAEVAVDTTLAPYRLEDMADDTAGLLCAMGAGRAHVVGVSMGAMIAQTLAVRVPSSVTSLCSIMSSTGAPDLGLPSAEALDLLMAPPPASRDEVIEAGVRSTAVFGSPAYPLDEAAARRRAALEHDRCSCPDGRARQMAAIVASGDRTAALADVRVPTLVIHGDEDPLMVPAHAKATARAIPGAELVMVPGMGHDLPPEVWTTVVDAIVANAQRAKPAGVAAGPTAGGHE